MSRRQRRPSHVRISIDDSELDALIAKVRSARAEFFGMAQVFGLQMRQQLRPDNNGFAYYGADDWRLYPVKGAKPKRWSREDPAYYKYGAIASSGNYQRDPGNVNSPPLFPLDFVGESAEYFKFGYMNRATRSVLTRMGASPYLYGIYRARAALIELSHGGPLVQMRNPQLSGYLFRKGAYSKLPHLEAARQGITAPSLGPAFMTNIHAPIAIALVAFELLNYGRRLREEQENLILDKEERMRNSTDMTSQEYKRWVKKNDEVYKKLVIW